MKTMYLPIQNAPDGAELWQSISGNFPDLAKSLHEFVDNALSDFRATNASCRRVEIRVAQVGGIVEVTVADTGSGIRDIHGALTLGSRRGAQSSLNEHGMGLKHALASVTGSDGYWSIQTRTAEDDRLDRHLLVESPYRLGEPPMTGMYQSGWGKIPGPTGTAISFGCTWDMFATLRPAGDRTEKSFSTLVEILVEELGYTYAPILESGELNLSVVTDKKTYSVTPVFPEWERNCMKEIGPTTVDLGGGPVRVYCCWGLIRSSKDNFLYYRGNMDSSGVEIRCNGRVMEHGLYKRIWTKQPHPSRNHFLVVVELTAKDASALPPTKPTKTGFRDGDPRLEKLFAWVRANVQLPAQPQSLEKRLVKALAAQKQKEPDVLRVATEEGTYCSLNLGVKMDLYVSRRDCTEAYEAKQARSRAQDLYQLRMYWDGCALDGRPIDRGILIARSHPREVETLLRAINGFQDPTGRPYNLSLCTWADQGIDCKGV